MDAKAPTAAYSRPPEEAAAAGDGAAAEALAPGEVVAGRYAVRSLLGEGGMGAVYLGEHLTVGRKVAIKVLHAEWSGAREIAARFAAEARTASAIGHPGIVDVLDAGSLDDGRLFLVMEFLDGRDLDRVLAEDGPMVPLQACRVVRAVAEAIAAAHAAGVIHRDLKPDNIIVVARGGAEVVKVLDFGVAADTERRAGTAARTTPGTAIGTPEHMSPEQAIGEAAGPHFDVYALGSVLFTLIAGRPPLVDANPLRLLGRKQTEEPPALGSLVKGLPPALESLVADALAIDVGRRPASVAAFVARLDGAIAALEAGAWIVGRDTNSRGAARTGRRPGLAIGAGVGMAAVGGLVWALARPPGEVGAASSGEAVVGEGVAPARGDGAMGVADAAGATGTAVDAGAVAAAIGEAAGAAPSRGGEADDAEAAAVASPAASGEADGAEVVTVASPVAASGGRRRKVVAVESAAGESAHRSRSCAQVRELMRVAHDSFDWATVLELARKRSCWESGDDARKLEVQARMELGDLDGCVRAAAGLVDREVLRWREICRKRGGTG